MLGIKNVYSRDRHKMNFVPFIDVVFMLIIYFLVATDMRPTEGDFVTNPRGNGPGEPIEKVTQKEVINVYVEDAGGNIGIKIGGIQVASFADLSKKLREAAHGSPDALAVIDGPEATRMQTIADTMDAAYDAGIPGVTFSDPMMKKMMPNVK
jgi:biopolymer transport protein ExbD